MSKVILCKEISVPEGKLCEAARCGDLDMVKKLIEEEEKVVNQLDVNGESSLIIASSLGHTEVAHQYFGAIFSFSGDQKKLCFKNV